MRHSIESALRSVPESTCVCHPATLAAISTKHLLYRMGYFCGIRLHGWPYNVFALFRSVLTRGLCAEYGMGSGLFFVGYTTFQIPSQLIVRYVGAPTWLAVIVTIWGITAASTAAVTNVTSFYILRTLLGFAEAGSFPGYWYYLTHFYPDSRITLPYAVTDSAIMVAQVRLHACNPHHYTNFITYLSSYVAHPAVYRAT